MKKIVAIIGSPKPKKQSSTYMATERFLDALAKAAEPFESEVIYLNEKNIRPCAGCLCCQQRGACVMDDDMASVTNRMSQADILMFGSPVHFGFVSSVFQTFIERSLIPLHTFALLGTPFLTVVTTNGSGEEEAEKYLSKIGYLFGCIKLGSIRLIDNGKFPLGHYNRMAQKTASVLAGSKVRPKAVNRLYFSSMKGIIQKNPTYFKAEAALWEEKKWFDKSYQTVFAAKQSAPK